MKRLLRLLQRPRLPAVPTTRSAYDELDAHVVHVTSRVLRRRLPGEARTLLLQLQQVADRIREDAGGDIHRRSA